MKLPPYHADLNAIELEDKEISSREEFFLKIPDVVKHAKEAFEKVTSSVWESGCKHVEDTGHSYWEQDIAFEAEIEFLFCSSDEATDTATEGENSETDTADETEVQGSSL